MSSIEDEIEALKEKQRLLEKSVEIARDAGFDTDDFGAERALLDAIENASRDHAYAMGDGPYKPVDYDFWYPASDEALAEYVAKECKRRNIAKLPPELDMVAELGKLDPYYGGEGRLSDAFKIVSTLAAEATPEELKKLEAFANKLGSQKEKDVQELGKFVSTAIVLRQGLI